jgi:hypothetical protein
MSICSPRVFKTRPVPTALCSNCERVTPFVCVECQQPLCATCMHQYTGMCAACCVVAHDRRQDITSLQKRANDYWWAFFDQLMLES